MSEALWLAETDPASLLRLISATASERKLRLWAIAWARWINQNSSATERMRSYSTWLGASVYGSQLDAAEQFADKTIDAKALRSIRHVSGGPWNVYTEVCRASTFQIEDVCRTLKDFQTEFSAPPCELVLHYLRDIFANPFRPVLMEPNWETDAVGKLAQAIYEERAFDRMPILADALEDAGCTSQEILEHCRGSGAHVRGCWVVDLLLNKE